MNCEDFKSVLGELAHDDLMEAEVRRQGLAHAAICANCASRLSEARGIRAVLQMTASAETESAPARVKQSLLAAFSEQQKGAAAPAAVIELSSRRRLGWLSVAAIAAAAVLLIALILPSLLRLSKPAGGTESAKAKDVMPIAPAATPERKQDAPAVPADHEGLTAKSFVHKSAPRVTMLRTPRIRNSAATNTTEASAKKNTNEYVPLTYLASATAMESGTIVRIQLSRSALMSLGLPLNIERADGLIKADLVVGDDGVARAIRLVD